jgi:hypothetical protein
MLAAGETVWTGRDAAKISNDRMELTVLSQGGHLADLRFRDESGSRSGNLLWTAPWMSSDQSQLSQQELSETAGFTGHGLCLDYFGPPSAQEAAIGLPLHGEAAAQNWKLLTALDGSDATCRSEVDLPRAQLRFERTIRLRDDSNVLYVEETVHNEKALDHSCHWVQHATFSPPFLSDGDSTLAVSATRGFTAPGEYDGESLLAANQKFEWPFARGNDNGLVDLRRPFSVHGRGCLAAVQMNPSRQFQFLTVTNRKLRLVLGYCFRQQDFPWMAIWEENCSRPEHPWNGNTRARGMEFGTTPLPLGREEIFRQGRIFDIPGWCTIPARGRKTARYLIFVHALPAQLDEIRDVEPEENQLVIHGEGGASICLPDPGCQHFLVSG